ncbi:hypothetical protein AXG93_2777s1020 [Marchantia polymorpha subsp. ruderalis]|uniref:Uncharacterized protein n=1 Tax=Marchantia polymorpha subsp. ruderalis TaxID=1480154 RepID=A0A176VPS4_MARPO|nr:hypothetical protein AXG93_2777s1020 [Marchantia polymorpha subsp. ruderalis]
MVLPKKSDKVQKLVPLKVPYEELRPFRRELSKLCFDFFLCNWNCISASIYKEIMDKNKTEGEYLRVAPIVSTPEVVVGESTQPVEIEGPSAILIKVLADGTVEPLKEGTEMVVAQVGGTVVDAADITLPSSPVEDVRSEEEKKTLGKEVKTLELKRAVAVKREWDSATEMARERAAILSAKCVAAKAALK